MSGRIVTLTLSPAIDLATETDVVAPTHKLRCDAPLEQPGGGGVNVARVATRLGADVVAVLPLGGATGERIGELLVEEHVAIAPVSVSASTRQSLSVTERATGDQYRFVLSAPALTDAEFALLADATVAACSGAACLVVSGQTPASLRGNVFADLVAAVAPVPVIIDTSGPAIRHALDSGAALVKPSARELSAIAGTELFTEEEILHAAEAAHADSSIETLAVSIGSGGAFAIGRGRPARRFRAPSVRVRSAIGAGDSMVAGIAVGLSRGDDLEQAISLGIAAGTATVLTDGTDLCRADDVERLHRFVTIDDAATH